MPLLDDYPELVEELWPDPPNPTQTNAFEVTATVASWFHTIDKWTWTRTRIRNAAEASDTVDEFLSDLIAAARSLDAPVTNASAAALVKHMTADVVRELRAHIDAYVLRVQVAGQHVKAVNRKPAATEMEPF